MLELSPLQKDALRTAGRQYTAGMHSLLSEREHLKGKLEVRHLICKVVNIKFGGKWWSW